jgi:hypothetical protein
MRRKTRSRPPAKVPSSAQPSTPTVRLAEQQTQRERGRGVGFQRAGAAARTSRPQHTGPDVQPATAAAVQASGDTMPTVRLAEQIQRERGRGVGFQRAGAASRRGSGGTQEPAGTRRPRRAAGRGGGRAGQRGHHDSGLPRSIRAAAVLRSGGTTAHSGTAQGSCVAARRGAAAAQPHAPGLPPKTHNSPAHATSPVSGRSAHGGRSYVFCSAHCARNSRVGAYAAVIRAVSAHAPGWPQKTHNSPAHPTSPVSGRSAHGGRSYVFCSALAATGLASLVLGEYELWRSSVCFRRMPIIASLKRLQI